MMKWLAAISIKVKFFCESSFDWDVAEQLFFGLPFMLIESSILTDKVLKINLCLMNFTKRVDVIWFIWPFILF
jgi:hypothetical protein